MKALVTGAALARTDPGFAPGVTLEQGIEAEYRWLSSAPVRA